MSKRVPLRKILVRGFVAGFLGFAATGIDELIAYSAVMLKPFDGQLMVAEGIVAADVLLLVVMFVFAPIVMRIPHKNALAGIGLAAISTLVFTGII